jgi:hypothetical protein
MRTAPLLCVSTAVVTDSASDERPGSMLQLQHWRVVWGHNNAEATAAFTTRDNPLSCTRSFQSVLSEGFSGIDPATYVASPASHLEILPYPILPSLSSAAASRRRCLAHSSSASAPALPWPHTAPHAGGKRPPASPARRTPGGSRGVLPWALLNDPVVLDVH